MTAKELMKQIGKDAVYHEELGLKVKVKILDARQQFGRVDYQVMPLAGEGDAWVSESRVTFGE